MTSLQGQMLNLLALIHAISSTNVGGLKDSCNKVCTKKDCVNFASALKSQLDATKDPCNNFYDYVCGRYPEDRYVPNQKKALISVIEEARRSMIRRLQDIVERDDSDVDSIRHKRKVIYDSCLNSRYNTNEIQTLVKAFQEVIPGWPNINTRNKDRDVMNWLISLNLMGEFSFYNFEIMYYDFDELRNFSDAFYKQVPPGMEPVTTTSVSPMESFLIPNSDPRKPVDKDDVENTLLSILSSAGLNYNVSKIIEDALRLDNLYTGIFRTNFNRYNINGNETKCLEQEGHWCVLLRNFFLKAEVSVNVTKAHLGHCEAQLTAIALLLTEEHKESIANYLAVRFLYDNVKILEFYTNKELDDTDVFGEVFGDPRSLTKNQRCTHFVADRMPYSVTGDYLVSVQGSEKLVYIIYIYEQIRNSAKMLLHSSPFSDGFKEAIERTLNMTELKLVQYVKVVNQKLETKSRFSKFQPKRHSFTLNILEAKKVSKQDKVTNYKLGHYFMPFTHDNNFFVDAGLFAEIDKVIINMGFGFLEPSFFDLSLPMSVNFGTMGRLLGHELGHALPFTMSLFHQFIAVDKVQLDALRLCKEALYRTFKIPYTGERVNPTRTYFEDLPDLFALTVTYHALQMHSKESETEQSIAGLNVTMEQLFFLSYAESWCEIGDRHSYKRYSTDVHSPLVHRVNGPLMNFEEFSEAFHCPVGSVMNPEKKCHLWE